MIQIQPYNSEWASEFAMIATKLRTALGDLARRIDHIGSTAVPNLAAKNVIDIQVTVAELSPDVSRAIVAAGYTARPSFNRDHVPPGCAENADDWTKLLFNEPPGERRMNIHVRRAGAANQRYALLFRDYLIAHPQSAAAYAELKRRLAENLADPATYPDVKDPAVDLIYLAAEAWAKATGWRAHL